MDSGFIATPKSSNCIIGNNVLNNPATNLLFNIGNSHCAETVEDIIGQRRIPMRMSAVHFVYLIGLTSL